MYEMNFPCEILFQTKHLFNDASTDDMQYSDLSASELRSLGLNDVSTRVDPYNMIFIDKTAQLFNDSFIPEYFRIGFFFSDITVFHLNLL